MKKVVLVNQSSGYLMIDIVNAFAVSGKYEKVVLAAGEIKTMGVTLHPDVNVLKIAKYNRKSIVKRTLSWIKATLQVLFLVWFKYRDYELFLVSNPPTISFITLFCRNKYSTLVYDVYPDGLIVSGFVKPDSLIVKMWTKLNRHFYNNAFNIFTITDGMAQLLSKHVDISRIKVIPLWASSGFSHIISKDKNLFIKENGLEDKFIVMYSGNIGLGHKVDLLLEIAERMKGDDEIIFVIIGKGWAKQKLIEQKELKHLNNVMFFDWQPEELIEHSLSAADIAYVSIEENAAQVCVPSKTFNLIKLNVPILSTAGNLSELYKLIEKYEIGKCFENYETDQIVDYIRTMKRNADLYNKTKDNLKRCAEIMNNNSKMFVE